MSPQGSQPVRHVKPVAERVGGPTAAPTEPPFPAGAVVVGVDGSPSSQEAVAWAARQAACDHRPLALIFAYDLDHLMWIDTMGADRELLGELRAEGGRLLDAAAEAAAEIAPETEILELLYHADARSALIDASHTAAMVVLGSRGRGRVASLMLGSVGVALVRHATCPVVVRRPEREHVSEGVLVGTDFSESSRPALEFAYGLASSRGLPLTVLTFRTWSAQLERADLDELDREDQQRLTGWLSDLRAKFPDVKITQQDLDEPEARTLVTRAAEKDVVVVGSQRGNAVASAIGQSLAVTVVEHAPTTVVVVPDVVKG